MHTETEFFYGSNENNLEDRIHYFFDQPGTKYVDARYFRDEDGLYAAEVTYIYTPPKEETP